MARTNVNNRRYQILPWKYWGRFWSRCFSYHSSTRNGLIRAIITKWFIFIRIFIFWATEGCSFNRFWKSLINIHCLQNLIRFYISTPDLLYLYNISNTYLCGRAFAFRCWNVYRICIMEIALTSFHMRCEFHRTHKTKSKFNSMKLFWFWENSTRENALNILSIFILLTSQRTISNLDPFRWCSRPLGHLQTLASHLWYSRPKTQFI